MILHSPLALLVALFAATLAFAEPTEPYLHEDLIEGTQISDLLR